MAKEKGQSRTDKRPKKKSGKKKIIPLKPGILQPRYVPPAATFGLEGTPHTPPPYGPVTAQQLISGPTARAEVSARRRRFALRSGWILEAVLSESLAIQPLTLVTRRRVEPIRVHFEKSAHECFHFQVRIVVTQDRPRPVPPFVLAVRIASHALYLLARFPRQHVLAEIRGRGLAAKVCGLIRQIRPTLYSRGESWVGAIENAALSISRLLRHRR